MVSRYQDKSTEFAAYRMLLAGINIAADILIVLITGITAPQIHPIAMCMLCMGLILVTLVLQIHIDRTYIFTGQFLAEDEKNLYAVISISGLKFVKRRYQRQQINHYRFFYFDCINKVENYPFGIRVNADVYTAATNEADLEIEMLNTPDAVKKILIGEGKKKKVVFRIEHNLRESEERRLLSNLVSLKRQSETAAK